MISLLRELHDDASTFTIHNDEHPAIVPSATKGKERFQPLLELEPVKIHMTKDLVCIRVNVTSYSPHDINVAIRDGFLSIEGVSSHYNRCVVKEFRRKFFLPENCMSAEASCVIQPDGFLQVDIPRTDPRLHGRQVGICQSSECRIQIDQPHNLQPRWEAQVTHNTTTDFSVFLSLPTFKPNEITITTVRDYLIVQGEHWDKAFGCGFIARSFKHRYLLPSNCVKDYLQCGMDESGNFVARVPKIWGCGGKADGKQKETLAGKYEKDKDRAWKGIWQ